MNRLTKPYDSISRFKRLFGAFIAGINSFGVFSLLWRCAGIAQELVDRTGSLGGGIGHIRMERGGDFVSMLTPVEPEAFKLAAARMCLEAGVTLRLHSTMDEVRASIGQAAGVAAALCCRSGCQPRHLDVPSLQQALIAQGAELRRGKATS